MIKVINVMYLFSSLRSNAFDLCSKGVAGGPAPYGDAAQ